MTSYLDISSAVIIVVITITLVIFRPRSYKLDSRHFNRKWKKLQKLCADKKFWYKAVIDADELLDEALKNSHFKGKTTGERLVAAQRSFTDNDSVWFGHKLKNRITDENYKRLNKGDTLEALAGFRQALKDLGALSSDRLPGARNDK